MEGCHPAYLTYMQSTSWETMGWKKHKLESRLQGEISRTSDMQMTPPLWQKVKRNKKPLDESETREWKSWLKAQHSSRLFENFITHVCFCIILEAYWCFDLIRFFFVIFSSFMAVLSTYLLGHSILLHIQLFSIMESKGLTVWSNLWNIKKISKSGNIFIAAERYSTDNFKSSCANHNSW